MGLWFNVQKRKGLMEKVTKLEDLPNIGSNLAALLTESGIDSAEELMEAGAIGAFMRIRAVEGDACFSKLCALEGAVEGIRWHHLSKDKKLELRHFFEMINKG